MMIAAQCSPPRLMIVALQNKEIVGPRLRPPESSSPGPPAMSAATPVGPLPPVSCTSQKVCETGGGARHGWSRRDPSPAPVESAARSQRRVQPAPRSPGAARPAIWIPSGPIQRPSSPACRPGRRPDHVAGMLHLRTIPRHAAVSQHMSRGLYSQHSRRPPSPSTVTGPPPLPPPRPVRPARPGPARTTPHPPALTPLTVARAPAFAPRLRHPKPGPKGHQPGRCGRGAVAGGDETLSHHEVT
jgi:hypothetical protein